jgi:hypothetical protein
MADCKECKHHSAMHTAGHSEENCSAGCWLNPQDDCEKMERRFPVGHIVPFANGSEAADYYAENCARCSQFSEGACTLEDITCPIERAVVEAGMDGHMPIELALRGGWVEWAMRFGKVWLMHRCLERDPPWEQKEGER